VGLGVKLELEPIIPLLRGAGRKEGEGTGRIVGYMWAGYIVVDRGELFSSPLLPFDKLLIFLLII
jgi:hypothetical protein